MGIESEAEGMQRRILVPVSVSAKMQSGNLVLGSGSEKMQSTKGGVGSDSAFN